MRSRQLGRFTIDFPIVEDDPVLVRTIMGQCVIVRAEMRYDLGAFEYHAISPQFAEVPPHCVPPEYRWIVTVPEQGPRSVKAERVTSNSADADDANRMRWLLSGHGYFMEEEMLCGHGPCSKEEQDEARRQIDAAMLERPA